MSLSGARRLLEPERLARHLDRLYRAAWALCGSAHDAEDLVQETYARVLAHPRLLRADDELPYLHRALRNTYLTGLRTAGRRPRTVELPADESETLRSPLAEPQVAPEQRELLATIAALPADLRAAPVAVDVVGLSYREAASALETRDTTITMRLFRARQRIASLVESRPAARGKEARPVRVLSVEMGGAGAQPTDADVAVLVALADGSLTPKRRAEAETAVAASAELRALLEGQVRAVALLRALDVPPPARLRARIEAASGAGAGRRSGEAP
jgi:RNA polymerase sigma-70 factor (ECF subfamily)